MHILQNRHLICKKIICVFHSSFSDFWLNMNDETLVDLDVDLSEDDIQSMLHHINQLDEIRMNQSFRTVFLFQEEPCSGFISEFSERKPRMLQFLEDLEENAVQLDRMNKGAKISSVAGSSVGAAGGVLSIVGLALIPVTAGASLVLTMTGLGLGITSRVNSLVTTATEVVVNRKHLKKASETFQSFMEDVQCLQECLEEVTKRETAEAAAKGPPTLSKSASLNRLNAFFFICKDILSTAKGSKTKFSQFIRARAALWRSEIDSWQKIHDFLCEGQLTSKKNKAVLETPFYPEREMEKLGETEMEIPFDEVDEKVKEESSCVIQ
ncbi:uncharacterized protein LOC141780585 [Sebastes fasciatus]|uniref:uncharacterized protein LOC141780585 n=1 Tax=Sebastes fasciatus TaxID=394691 RepID=UPI003D9E47CC